MLIQMANNGNGVANVNITPPAIKGSFNSEALEQSM
jgi:hypothetical protein